MQEFTIKDPNSGQLITLRGETPPTEQELEEIFSGKAPEGALKAEAQVNVPKDITKSFMSELAAIPRSAAKFGSEKLRPLLGKEPLSEEKLEEIYKIGGAEKYEPQTWQGNIGGFAGTLAPYAVMPQATIPKLMASSGLIEGTKAYGENKNPLLTGLLAALTGGVTAKTLGLLGKSTNWMAGIPQDVAERATNPASETLAIAKAPDAEFAIQDAWDTVLNKLRTKTSGLKEEAGKQVGKAKEEGFEGTKSIMGVQSKLSTQPYVDILEEMSANRPKNIKISTKERDLNKYTKDYLKERQLMSPQEIQQQMDILDTDFINWEAGLGKTKTFSEKNAMKAAKKIRNLMNEDLIRVTGGETAPYAQSKETYSQLLDLLKNKGKNPQIIEANEQQAINLLRQLEKPASGNMRKSLQSLETEINEPIIEQTRNVLAGEKLQEAFGRGQQGQPDAGKLLRALPLWYAQHVGLPYQKGLNKILPQNKQLLQKMMQLTTSTGVAGQIPAEQYRNRK